jgi:S-DNA-T family DNA segregation ATPase FtsK/SpoIIIE
LSGGRLILLAVAAWFVIAAMNTGADQVREWASDPAHGAAGLVAVGVFCVAVVVVPVVARRLRSSRPWTWWPLFGAPVAVARMVITWRATCEGLGLSVPARRFNRYGLAAGAGSGRGRRGGAVVVKGEPLKLIPPRRVRVSVNRCGLAVTVRMHPSQVPGQWERGGDAFTHAWRVHRVRVTTPRPGFVTLTALGFDPLRQPPTPPARHASHGGRGGNPPGGPGPLDTPGQRPGVTWRMVPSSPANAEREVGQIGRGVSRSDYAVVPGVLKVTPGVREDGGAWSIDLKQRPHWLVTGATQSGKSTLTVRVLSELAARPVGLVGIDAKGGMELSPFGPRLSALATSRSEAAAAIDALTGVLGLRMLTCREAGARSIWDLPTHLRPEPVVTVVDEVAELFLSADRAGKEEVARCVTGLVRLGQLGAAVGMHLWVAAQRFGSDLGPGATLLRAQLAGRICHRVADAETAGMTLDGLGPEAVEEAQRIPADLPGVAVVGDDSGAWFLARSLHPITVDEAARTARAHAGLAVPMPDVAGAIEDVRNLGDGPRGLGGGW